MRNLNIKLKKKFSRKFGSEMRFIKNWVGTPKSVGAIWPTSTTTARRMAEVVNPQSGLPVLELGPGTGVITKAILRRGIDPKQLYSVEYCREFLVHLRKDFEDVNFIQGDAFDIEKISKNAGVPQFDCVISGLPLLNFSSTQRVNLIESLLNLLPPGRPVVQFCYGPLSPVVAGRGNYNVKHYDWIARNVPPARLWIYSRDH